jgi:hypothetical protein
LLEGLTLDEKVHGQDGPPGVSSNPTPGPIPQSFVKGATEMGFTQVTWLPWRYGKQGQFFSANHFGGRRADVASSYLFNNRDRHHPNLTIIAEC